MAGCWAGVRRARRFALGAAIVAQLLTALPSVCMAQSQQEIREARGRGRLGIQLFNAGKFEEAYQQLSEANELYHAPTLVLYMARCQNNLGKLLKAREHYRAVVDEKLDPASARQFEKARDEAAQELEELEPKIPILSVWLKGRMARKAVVTVDGEPRSRTDLAAIRMDLGEHKVAASAEGATPVERTVTLAPGARESVQLVMEPAPLSAAAPPPAPAPKPKPPAPAPPKPDGEGASTQRMVGWAALGLGAGGAVIGTIAGVMSLSARSGLDERCPDGQCAPVEGTAIDHLGRTSAVAVTGLALGGVGLAAGSVMIATAPNDDASTLDLVSAGLLGVGAAGLIGGAVSGLIAVGARSDLDDACPDKRCTPDQQGAVDSHSQLGTLGIVSLVTGAAAAGAGVTLMLVAPNDHGPSGGGADAAASLRVTPTLGGGTLEGSF